MRPFTLLLSGTFACCATAQVINGSFENAGAFDLSGWTWQCTTPEPVMPGAPGAGDFGVRKPFSNTQGCFFEHLTQHITSATWGEVFTLSGWVMREDGAFTTSPGLYFAEDSMGIVIFRNGITTDDTTWTWLQVADTVYPDAFSTPMILLHTGLTGGPGFGWSRFDGIELHDSLTTAIDDAPPFEPPFHLEGDRLFVHVGARAIDAVDLFDLTGRTLPVRAQRAGATLQITLPPLTRGIYLARIASPDGQAVLRFARR